MDGLRDAFGDCEEPSIRASHAVFVVGADAADSEGWIRESRPDLRVMSAGEIIEIYKETGLARGVRGRVRARGLPGHARSRPHAHGDGEPGDDGGLAPVLDRSRPLPRPQRVALEPQPPAREPAPRGDRVPDRERHRGRRRLPRLAHARGRLARAGTRGLPRGPGRLLHLRRRDRRWLRGPARSDRVQAGRARGDRRLGRDVLGVAGDRRPARAPPMRAPGSPSRESSTRGRRSPPRPDGCALRQTRPSSRSSTSSRLRSASSTSGCTTSPAELPARDTGGSSTRTAPMRSRAGSTPMSRSRSTGTSGTTARA